MALLRLDRPDARNAINTAMLEELLAHIAAARDDDAVRVLVISSSDHMALSAGADVREELEGEAAIHRMQLFADLYDDLTGFPKPTIAVCHGATRRRRRRGRGRLRPARRRLEPAAALPRRRAGRARSGPARLATLCGLSVAKYMLLTGKEIDADMALRWGLVHKVAPAAATENAALELASQVAANPPEAVARLKRMLHEWDGVVERSQAEGEGQVEWLRSGPGFPTGLTAPTARARNRSSTGRPGRPRGW